MGIHLDWKVEEESQFRSIKEDAEIVAARHRHMVRGRRTMIVLAVILVLAGLTAFVRVRQVAHLRRVALEDTVAAESLALRLSDQRQFLQYQMDQEDWRDQQKQTFARLQTLGDRAQFPGDILNMEMAADEARVTVREVIDSQPLEAVWIYHYTDHGWRHIASEGQPWDRVTRQTEYFEVSYEAMDVVFVDATLEVLNQWWKVVQDDTRYTGDPLHLKLTFTSKNTPVAWASLEDTELRIPTVDGAGDPRSAPRQSTLNTMATFLAKRWIQYLTDPDAPIKEVAVISEANRWLEHRFNPDTVPSPTALDALTAAFGPDLVPDFFRELQNSPSAALALREAMQENAPGDLHGDALLEYLTNFMFARFTYLDPSRSGALTTSQISTIFYDESGSVPAPFSYSYYNFLPPGELSSLRAVGTYQFQDVLWAEMEFEQQFPWEQSPHQTTFYAPFRWSQDGFWVATEPAQDDWGKPLQEQSGTITLHYFELDAPSVAGLASELDRIAQRIATVVGLPETPPIEVTIFQGTSDSPTPGSQENAFWLISPYQGCCPFAANSRSYLRRYAASRVVYLLYQQVRGDQSTVLDGALTLWITQEIGQLPDRWERFAGYDLSAIAPPENLASLWTYAPNWGIDEGRMEADTYFLSGSILIDMLVERQGEEVIPRLIGNLDEADSTDEWLRLSAGVASADIESEWLDRFHVALDEIVNQ